MWNWPSISRVNSMFNALQIALDGAMLWLRIEGPLTPRMFTSAGSSRLQFTQYAGFDVVFDTDLTFQGDFANRNQACRSGR